MKSLYLLLAGLVVGLIIGVAPGLGQDTGKETDDNSEEGGGMHDAWTKLQAPGEEHEWLAESEGEWNIEARMWMEGSEEPMTMTGTSTIKMLWGRYLYEEFTVGEGEMQFEGRGYIGYDNSAEEFCAVYFGNNGTGLRVLKGKREGDKLTFSGEWTEKGLGNMKVSERVESVEKEDGSAVVTMYGKYGADAPETKMMEMTYTRKE